MNNNYYLSCKLAALSYHDQRSMKTFKRKTLLKVETKHRERLNGCQGNEDVDRKTLACDTVGPGI